MPEMIISSPSLMNFLPKVLATKLNAEQCERLIGYLGAHDEDIIRWCFSRSNSPADSEVAEWTDPNLLLDLSRTIVDYFAKHRAYLAGNHRSRLIPKYIATSSQPTLIDDRSVSWLFNNFDAISPAIGLDCQVILRGRRYNVGAIGQVELTEDANVFENQVLYGLLQSLRIRLTSQLRQSPEITVAIDAGSSMYVSLPTLLNKCLPVNMEWKSRCQILIDETSRLIKFFDRYIPVKYTGELYPRMTPAARTNPVYRQLFLLASRWYGLGMASWKGQEYLASLLSITKLYEIFCLIGLLKIFKDLGFNEIKKDFRVFDISSAEEGNEYPRPDLLPCNNYLFQLNKVKVRLAFEPTVFPPLVAGRYSRLVDLSHIGSGRWRFRQPDFIIYIEYPGCPISRIVLDSKYSRATTAVRDRLPDIVNKYLLGFGLYNPAAKFIESPDLLGVLVLHPESNLIKPIAIPKMHHARHDSYGDASLQILPMLASVELSPERNSPLKIIISDLLEAVKERASQSYNIGIISE